MPAVAKTSDAEIVATARELIARDGYVKLSLQEVARKVGVRASSFYKRFADRDALLRAVAHQVLLELEQLQQRVATTGSPAKDLRAIAHAHRRFAAKHRHLYELVFGPALATGPTDPAELGGLVKILLDRVGQLVEAPDVLKAARLLVAFTHGFIAMELSGAFRLGGELDEAFEFGVTHAIASLRPSVPSRPAPTARSPARPRPRPAGRGRSTG